MTFFSLVNKRLCNPGLKHCLNVYSVVLCTLGRGCMVKKEFVWIEYNAADCKGLYTHAFTGSALKSVLELADSYPWSAYSTIDFMRVGRPPNSLVGIGLLVHQPNLKKCSRKLVERIYVNT